MKMSAKKILIPKEKYTMKLEGNNVIVQGMLEFQCADCLHNLYSVKEDNPDGTWDMYLIKDCFCTGKKY